MFHFPLPILEFVLIKIVVSIMQNVINKEGLWFFLYCIVCTNQIATTQWLFMYM